MSVHLSLDGKTETLDGAPEPIDGTTELSDERDRSTRNLLHHATLVSDEATRQDLFDQAVLLNQPMARTVAQQYQRRGVDREDLMQVAMLGLVKAVRGYRPQLQKPFAAYAVPTISGEIKRYFRDRGWMIRPPRSLQELSHVVRMVEPDLAQALQRMPTIADFAQHLGVDASAVHGALDAGRTYRITSLDAPLGDSGQLLSDIVADPNDLFESADALLTLRPVLDALGPRERCIIKLRFVDNLTQEEIGERIGVSQMQVSRLLTAILAQLRKSIKDELAA